ncbi:hypothetical protein ACFQZV_04335 [Microbacterium koreense]|uniref:Uncharacterized protein n=1 Tax=Microbacterium koreense TaxID=323761 RepID=A0ABW2ZQL8_9MICO
MDRDLPEGMIDAFPPGGWERVSDGDAAAQDAAAQESPDLRSDAAESPPAPDDPVEGEAVRQSADPDMHADSEEGPS